MVYLVDLPVCWGRIALFAQMVSTGTTARESLAHTFFFAKQKHSVFFVPSTGQSSGTNTQLSPLPEVCCPLNSSLSQVKFVQFGTGHTIVGLSLADGVQVILTDLLTVLAACSDMSCGG